MTLSLQQIIDGIHPVNHVALEKARARTAQLVMPPRALGRLHAIGEQLSGIQGTLRPQVRGKAVLVMAGDHGIVAEGISAFPQAVTGAMIQTFLAGGAGINAIARQVGAEVWVADMGIIPDLEAASVANGGRLLVRKVGPGTANFARGPAMRPEQAYKAILTGFELASSLFDRGIDLLGTGDMGIGNTTASAAIGAAITGKSIADMVGPGTGIDDAGIQRTRLNQVTASDPGLVGFWQMDQNLEDASPMKNHGQASGSVQFVEVSHQAKRQQSLKIEKGTAYL